MLLLAAPLCVSAGTSAQTTVSAAVRSTEIPYYGNNSDTFRVAVDLSLGKDEPGIASYVVTVRWDPNVLELVASPDSYEGTGCYFTDAFSEGWEMVPNGTATLVNTAEASKGKLTVISGNAKNRDRSDGTLFVLNFRPKKGDRTTEITVAPGSSNVAPSAAFSTETGKITNVAAETKLTLTLTATTRRGDVNGSGKIDARDYMLIKRHVLGTYTLPAKQQISADVNNNGKVDATDYMLVKRHVLGTYQIP